MILLAALLRSPCRPPRWLRWPAKSAQTGFRHHDDCVKQSGIRKPLRGEFLQTHAERKHRNERRHAHCDSQRRQRISQAAPHANSAAPVLPDRAPSCRHSIAHELAVRQSRDSIREAARQRPFMRHHDDCHSHGQLNFLQQLHHRFARRAVEISGGLVGK